MSKTLEEVLTWAANPANLHGARPIPLPPVSRQMWEWMQANPDAPISQLYLRGAR